jgi:hypothetical protein
MAMAPPDAAVAPPGPYLLFLVDEDGVPSMGQVVRTNLPPEANDDAIFIDEDDPLPSDLTGLALANDLDVEGDAIDVVGDAPRFDRPPDWSGEIAIPYVITDGVAEAAGTITIHAAPVNDPPIAMDDVVRAEPGETVTANLLDNDRDPDGTPRLVRCTLPQFGLATCLPDGTLTYTAGEQDDVFTYTILDEANAEATATVSILVFDDTCDGYCCCKVSRPRAHGAGARATGARATGAGAALMAALGLVALRRRRRR